jgi:hypothetical protein
MRHNITGLALSDLLLLMNTIVPGCVPKTKYFVEDGFLSDCNAEFCFYCRECLHTLGREPAAECPACDAHFDMEIALNCSCVQNAELQYSIL